jgi:hypothetical protein
LRPRQPHPTGTFLIPGGVEHTDDALAGLGGVAEDAQHRLDLVRPPVRVRDGVSVDDLRPCLTDGVGQLGDDGRRVEDGRAKRVLQLGVHELPPVQRPTQ